MSQAEHPQLRDCERWRLKKNSCWSLEENLHYYWLNTGFPLSLTRLLRPSYSELLYTFTRLSYLDSLVGSLPDHLIHPPQSEQIGAERCLQTGHEHFLWLRYSCKTDCSNGATSPDLPLAQLGQAGNPPHLCPSAHSQSSVKSVCLMIATAKSGASSTRATKLLSSFNLCRLAMQACMMRTRTGLSGGVAVKIARRVTVKSAKS
jgi:hypothetical protein